MKKRVIAAFLALLVMLTVATLATASQEASTIEIFAKNTTIGNEIEFTQKDFTSRIVGDDELQGIIITALPESEIGNLMADARALMVGEAVTLESLGSLRYVPVSENDISYTNFSFLPVFSAGVSANTVTINLAVLEEEKEPPTAHDVVISTFKNVAVTGRFNAEDSDGGPLTFRVSGKSRRGEVTVNPDGSFIYTPYHNKHGRDSFSYVAIDQYGNTSAPAKVSVTIERQQSSVSYQDMNSHPAHYAALRLAEENLLVGEQVGSHNFFRPDEVVTRAEFLALIVSTLQPGEAAPTLRTNFADDEYIPVWAKPYINLAASENWVNGIMQEDGRRAFRPELPITQLQATVLLNNVLDLPKQEMAAVFASCGNELSIPTWAEQSVANARELLTNVDFSVSDTELTRGDVAIMLHQVMQNQGLITPTAERTGIFSWLLG